MNRKLVCAAAVLAIVCAVSPVLASGDDDDRRGSPIKPSVTSSISVSADAVCE